MGKHSLNPDRINWPWEDPDEEERTVRTFPVPDIPPIETPKI